MLEALDRPRAQSLPLQRPGRLEGARGWLVRLHAQHPVLAPLAAFAVLAIIHTWPLASNPAHLSRNDQSDALMDAMIAQGVLAMPVVAAGGSPVLAYNL